MLTSEAFLMGNVFLTPFRKGNTPRKGSITTASLPNLMNFPNLAKIPLPTFVLALACFCLTGCLDSENLVWLPDSSGIIYTEQGGSKLVRYDLSTKISTPLQIQGDIKTALPAISPDGKMVAVGEIKWSTSVGSVEETAVCHIAFYNLTGQEVKRSSAYTTTRKRGAPAEQAITYGDRNFLFWSPLSSKLCIANDAFFSHDICCIYDYVHDTWLEIDKGWDPLCINPISTKENGFLASNDKFVGFISWDGWVTKFQVPNKRADEKVDDFYGVDVIWNEDTAMVIINGKGVAQFNTSKGTCSFQEEIASDVLAGDGELRFIKKFKHGGAQLCIFVAKNADPKLPAATTLEIQVPSLKKQKVILRDLGSRICYAFPSPDGDSIAIRCSVGDAKDVITIISNQGVVLGSLRPEPEPSASRK